MKPASDEQSVQLRREMVFGVLLWLTFCVAAVLLRGVRWDEALEDAQILLRQVPYPEGHPRFVYCRNAFSLQTYGSACLLWLGAGPALLCGLRNVAALALSVLPVFLFASVLSRKALWGHAAALLALQGAYLEFDSSYPLTVWPGYYTYGQIGTGYALLTAYFMMGERWGAGFALLGLMPCIHVGQMPALAVLGGICVIRAWRNGNRPGCRRAFGGLLAGLSGCAIFYAIQRGFLAPLPNSSSDDAAALWATFTAYHDIHRQLPPGNGHVALIGLLLLAAGAWRVTQRSANPRLARIHLGILAYTGIVAATAWGIMAVHDRMGAATPFFLLGWMPYRLMNHAPPLLLALAVGFLARSGGAVLVVLALVFDVLTPFWAHLLPDALFTRYVAGNEAILFALCGAAFGALIVQLRTDRRFYSLWSPLLVVGVLALGIYHHFGFSCCVAGLVAGLIVCKQPIGWAAWLTDRRLVTASCLLLCLVCVVQETRHRTWLPHSAFNVRVAAYLDQRGEAGAMLVGAPDSIMVQAQTGHPVLAHQDTPYMLSYIPALGPAIEKMYEEVYSMRFGKPRPSTPDWTSVWAERGTREWQERAAAYRFRYVIATESMRLNLPEVLRESGQILYEIPQ